MKWLRKLLGTDFPGPVVGQVWRSRNNGEDMRVSEVHIDTFGALTVYTTTWLPATPYSPPQWCMVQDSYAYGLGRWRRKLRAERRILVDFIEL